MKSKKQYIAPSLKEYSYRAEDGYALSLLTLTNDNILLDDHMNNQEQWSWDSQNETNNHFGGDWNW